MEKEKHLSGEESIALITSMINKAKDARHETGVAAIMWGIVIAFCSLEKLAEIQFGYELPFDIYILTFIAVIPQIYFVIKEKKERKAKTYGDVFFDNLWFAFGIGVFLTVFITNSMFAVLQPVMNEYKALTGHSSSFKLYEFTACFFLLIYGFPTFVTGMSLRFTPMIIGGIVCWVFAILAIYTNIKIDLLLLAIAAITAWLIPGIIMEKDYRKAKRELSTKNV